MKMTADNLVSFLELKPHPEGGWYKGPIVQNGARGAVGGV